MHERTFSLYPPFFIPSKIHIKRIDLCGVVQNLQNQQKNFLLQFVLLVSSEMLVSVINSLLQHSMGTLRRKAMDLLNAHIQSRRDSFTAAEKQSLRTLLEPLVEIIKSMSQEADKETELAQQTALYSIKLLAKVLASEDIRLFKEVFAFISPVRLHFLTNPNRTS